MISLQEKQISLTKKGTYDFIKGEFSAEEALEIINDVYSKKINFHEAKSFSQFIRFGAKDPKNMERIKELKLSHDLVKQAIVEAKKSGKSLQINSTISIETI